jgi:hypothetical protein
VESLNGQMKLIKTWYLSDKNCSLNMEEFKEGLYFVRVIFTDGSAIVKPMIKIK